MAAEGSTSDLGVGSAWPRRLVAAALCLVALGTLGRVVAGLEGAAVIARLGVVSFALLAVAGQVWRVRILFAATLLLSSILIARSDGLTGPVLETLGGGLDTAAFLGAFLVLLGVLRDAAETSPAVRDCGALMTAQPPGRRYLALHIGGHFLGTLLSFGVLSLLGPMIQRGVTALGRAGPAAARLAAVRERRQLSALLRGFSWMILWSPTTITQALLFSLIPGIEAGRLLLLGALLALLVLLLGWAEDRVRWRRFRRPAPVTGVATAVGSASALSRMGQICAAAVATVVITQLLLGLATVPALMLGVPCFAFGWIVAQRIGRGPRRALQAAAQRTRQTVAEGFVEASPEVLTLACAGFIGTLAAALVPSSAIAGAVLWTGASPILFLAAVTLSIVLLAQLALSPLMALVFLGSALAETQVPGVTPTALGLALAAGWALSLTGSPFTAATLILARVTRLDGHEISWRWNGVFTPLAFGAVVLCLYLAILTT